MCQQIKKHKTKLYDPFHPGDSCRASSNFSIRTTKKCPFYTGDQFRTITGTNHHH